MSNREINDIYSEDNEVALEEKYTFVIDQDSTGTRVDRVLALLLPESSRSYIQKLIENGNLKIDGKVCSTKKYKVTLGQMAELTMPEPEVLSVEAENIPLNIVYEDDDLLVVDKPKGMVVHPGAGNETGTLVNAIMYHCGNRLSSINGVVRPGIVHRIDKDTSGLLMIAKNNTAHESLSAQLAKHSIVRRYVALVYDNLTEDEGTVNAPIGRDPKNRLRMAVVGSAEGHDAGRLGIAAGNGGRHAVTHWTVKKRYGRYTLIEARLETGRTHQIRVHMSYIHHPLVGDLVYGPKRQTLSEDGQLLHARVLGFIHPRTGEYMEFESTLPKHFTQILDKLDKTIG